MRIGVNTLFMVPGDVGGTEVYLRETLRAMARLNADDTLVLFTNLENDSAFREDLVDHPLIEFHKIICCASVRPFRILMEQFMFPFIVGRKKIDVLWSPGYTAPAICRCPQAVTIHDLQYKSHPEDIKLHERVVLDILVKTACRCCAAIITISSFSKKELVRFGFAKPEKIHAIPEGVTKHFSTACSGSENQKDEQLAQWKVRRPYLLTVAHTYPHKNVDKLIDAFARFQEDFPHQLVLVGKPRRGEKKIKDSLNRMPDTGRVIRLSGLTEDELRLLYQNADIFVLPSSYEGFGLPVLEAMMAGTPVITTRMASLPELAGEYVQYVDTPSPENLLKAFNKVKALPAEQRQQHLAGAKKRAETFTWEKTAEQTLQVLRAIYPRRVD